MTVIGSDRSGAPGALPFVGEGLPGERSYTERVLPRLGTDPVPESGGQVLIVAHPHRVAARELADWVALWWRERGVAATVIGSPGSALETDGGLLGATVRFALSLGGDGTMLRTVGLARQLDAPVLGVNLGRLGYLTEVEPGGLPEALERLFRGDYGVEERMTLDVTVERAGGGSSHYVVLNEVIVEKIGSGHTICLAVEIAGKPFLSYVADGLIVATPTGSTAYNLSARGPILSPHLRAVLVTPVSPHLLFDRSLVLDEEEVVAITLSRDRGAVIVLDGAPTEEIEPGDRVSCAASVVPARLITFGARDFHAILRIKFGLGDG
jgi:NAD+ kinase